MCPISKAAHLHIFFSPFLSGQLKLDSKFASFRTRLGIVSYIGMHPTSRYFWSDTFTVHKLIVAFSLQQLNLLKAKQKALVEQIEKEKIQSNKGSSYKLLVEQAKLKQATSKVSSSPHTQKD